MTHEKALELLELEEGASAQEIRSAYQELFNELNIRLTNAPTDHQKQLYTRRLQDIEKAYLLLGGMSQDDVNELPSISPVEISKEAQAQLQTSTENTKTQPQSIIKKKNKLQIGILTITVVFVFMASVLFKWQPWNSKNNESNKHSNIALNESHSSVTIDDNKRAIEELLNNLVSVDGGTFIMGCYLEQASDCESYGEIFQHVTLNNFSIGKYEVTQAQWKAVTGTNPSKFIGCDNCPVEQVSWNDIQDFFHKLNELTGKKYRLPTEAEWEYAARGGIHRKSYKYSGSDSLSVVAWYDDNSGSTPHPVGQKSPNELGLYDMSGNVWEWCSDKFEIGSYSMNSDIDEQAHSIESERVIRGGSYINIESGCEVFYRSSGSITDRFNNLGFRVVYSL
jgi:formylglycine-generating enzyme required for sulfatase activity